jgi:hypothetical protein
MSFFEDASLVLIPSGIKNAKVYSVKPTDGTGDLTFSRASSATRVASNGLIEKVRTNLFEYSNTFSNAYWTTPQASVVSGQPDPSGGSTAFKLVEDTSTNFHWLLKSGPLSSAGEWGLSIFAKPAGRNFIAIGNASLGELAYFNLLNGTIVSSHANAVGKIEAAGNGFYRCSVTLLTSGASATGFFISTDGSTTSYTGDGTSGLIIFGAQLETGVTTDYIATTTAAVSVGPVSGLPRLDYLGSTCPRLLLEPQRSSLVLYSEQMDNASWIKLNGAVTANTAVSPDGYTNADKFVPNTTSGIHALRSNLFNQSATASHSWFVKADGYSKIAVRESELVGNYASFNLSTGALISTNATGSIVNYGNGWYRCTLVDTTTGANAQTSILVLPDSYTTGDPLTNWSGDGTKGVLAYGCQVEVGAYATSYIPTLGASVTRVADAASKTGISSLIGQTEGTLFVDFTINGLADYGTPISVNDGTATRYIWFTIFANGTLRAELYDGAVQASISFTGAVVGGRYKMAFGYKTNDFAFYVNGALVGTDLTGATFSGTTLSRVDTNLTNASIYSLASESINQALLFKTRLTNAQLAELTA